jgi:hypothetical protein
MKTVNDPLDQNPFNVPFVLGEMVNKLMNKLEESPSKVLTREEIITMIDEIILQICCSTEQEMIKGRALEFLFAYLSISKN